jgi:hypothetical protein
MLFGVALILAGILGLKLTDLNMYWASIAAGAAIGSYGGISVSKRARS